MILEEGNLPYPRCPKCDIFVLQWALNFRHPSTDLFRRVEERKHHRLAADEARVGSATALTAYGIPLVPISSFKYLGITLLASYDDWTAVVRNLKRAHKKWARLAWVLGREGADARTPGMFCIVVVQTVILYGFGKVGYVPAHWDELVWLPPQGIPKTYGTAKAEGNGWDVGVTPSGGRNGGCRPVGGGDLSCPPTERSRTVHCNQAHYELVSGGGATPGDKGVSEVVGAMYCATAFCRWAR